MSNPIEKIQYRIEELLRFGVANHMMEDWDYPLVRNQLLSLFGIKEAYSKDLDENEFFAGLDGRNPLPILEDLLNYAVKIGMIEDNTTEKDLLDAKIMGCLMPRQSELKRIFEDIRNKDGAEKATDFFYHLSIASNYIRMDRIAKNIYWEAETDFGNLEITINLSKPEKDPKEIAKAKLLPQSNYPKCLLCIENVGFEGNMNHPGRSNHRVLPVTLKEEQWFFQYSPYVYYNEHSIIFKGKHEPMKISKASFERLVDFVEQYPHYLFVVEGAANAVQDESGNWVEGEVKIKFHSRCREEVDGRGTEIAVAGGTFHKVTSLIQIPKGKPTIALGTPVIVSNDDECNDVRIKGVCLRYDPSQFHSRLWV